MHSKDFTSDDLNLQMADVDVIDLTILAYLKKLGPEYAKLLSRRLSLTIEESFERLQKLQKQGLITRIDRSIVKYYHRRRKNVKHRNHTYYELTRDGEHLLRLAKGKVDISVDIEFPNR